MTILKYIGTKMSFHIWEICFQTYEAIAGRKDENVSITWVTALWRKTKAGKFCFGLTIVLLRTNAGRYTLPYVRSSTALKSGLTR